ncbi:MAG: sigma-70 family RNA polymerase sigma factor [Candidatus Eisenbacteria bacterium]|nr:sigma-70 family RNA polymerase sigma factor [Candidatus Eisenbacteria bacterium]
MRLPPLPGMLDPDEDARLVARCLSGDARAWEAMVRRHERLVYAVARSYRLSDPDLGDVFQEVFAALVKGLPSLRDPRSLVRWLSSTTDRIARATALRRRREQALHTGDPVTLERLAAGGPPVGAELESFERQAMVRLAFSALGERCRRLLGALYYEEEPASYAELARRLGMPMNSLGPNRARCLERLRDIFARMAKESRTKTRRAATSAPERPKLRGPDRGRRSGRVPGRAAATARSEGRR